MKKSSAKKVAVTQPVSSNKRRYGRLVIVGAVLIMALALAWLMRPSVFSEDKNALRQNITSALSGVQSFDSVAFEHIDDKGCERRQDTVATHTTSCRYWAYKMYAGERKLSDSLRQVDNQLRESGFHRSLFSGQTNDDFEKALDGIKGHDTLRYEKDNLKGTALYLSYALDNGASNDSTIKNLIKEGKLTAPDQGKYVYGIYADAAYFSCSNDSFFQLPCPAPPSEAKR